MIFKIDFARIGFFFGIFHIKSGKLTRPYFYETFHIFLFCFMSHLFFRDINHFFKSRGPFRFALPATATAYNNYCMFTNNNIRFNNMLSKNLLRKNNHYVQYT